MNERMNLDRQMAFIPHTSEERQQMLEAIGAESLEELFRDIPADVRFPGLRLPEKLTEMELDREIRRIARRNRNLAGGPFVPWSGLLSSLHSGNRRLCSATRRVLHVLHALPAGAQPRSLTGDLRVPDDDLPPDRNGGE